MRAGLLLLVPCCAALKFMEISPLKGAMLAKQWQAIAAEADQKVGSWGEGVSVLRFGDDLERRTNVAKAMESYVKTSIALAAAAKGGGAGRTKCYAAIDGVGPNTLSMVKRESDAWTLTFLLSNPHERDLGVIGAAEAEAVENLAELAGDVPLKCLGGVEETLVSEFECDGEGSIFKCKV